MSIDVTSCGGKILEILKSRLPAESFDTWFGNAEILRLTDAEIEIGAANLFVKSWIEKTYAEAVRAAALEATGLDLCPVFSVSAAKFRELRARQEQELAVSPTSPARKPAAAAADTLSEFRKIYTFENFIAGDSNRLAHAVCRRAAEKPGEYTPLVLQGGHGCGKTHLLKAICREFSAARGGTVLYLTSSQFLAAFVAASKEGTLEQFRRRLQACDVFALDDLHQLASGSRGATQTELAHAIESLCEAGRQVVVAAQPAGQEKFVPQLVSLLQSGLTVALDLPEAETRLNLAHAKAYERGLKLSPDLARGIAEKCRGAREVEGAVKRLAALAALEGKTGAVEAGSLVPRPFGAARREYGCAEIVAAVAAEAGLSQSDLTGKSRGASARAARGVALRLCRALARCTLARLGAEFGGRTHSTVLAAFKSGPLDAAALALADRALARLGAEFSAGELLREQGGLFDGDKTVAFP